MPVGTVGSDGILRRTDRPDTFRGAETPPAFLSPRFRVGGGHRAAEEAEAREEHRLRELAGRKRQAAQAVGRKRSPAVAFALAAIAAGSERKRRAAQEAKREAEFQAAWAERVAAMRNEIR